MLSHQQEMRTQDVAKSTNAGYVQVLSAGSDAVETQPPTRHPLQETELTHGGRPQAKGAKGHRHGSTGPPRKTHHSHHPPPTPLEETLPLPPQ